MEVAHQHSLLLSASPLFCPFTFDSCLSLGRKPQNWADGSADSLEAQTMTPCSVVVRSARRKIAVNGGGRVQLCVCTGLVHRLAHGSECGYLWWWWSWCNWQSAGGIFQKTLIFTLRFWSYCCHFVLFDLPLLYKMESEIHLIGLEASHLSHLSNASFSHYWLTPTLFSDEAPRLQSLDAKRKS